MTTLELVLIVVVVLLVILLLPCVYILIRTGKVLADYYKNI